MNRTWKKSEVYYRDWIIEFQVLIGSSASRRDPGCGAEFEVLSITPEEGCIQPTYEEWQKLMGLSDRELQDLENEWLGDALKALVDEEDAWEDGRGDYLYDQAKDR